MIFITCGHRYIGFIDHEWNNCFCPCRLRWPRVMKSWIEIVYVLVHNLPMTCKHFTRLPFRLVSPPTIATPNNNLLNLFSRNRESGSRDYHNPTSDPHFEIPILKGCGYMIAIQDWDGTLATPLPHNNPIQVLLFCVFTQAVNYTICRVVM